MVNKNLIPKVEEICELKYEIPTYEEFMKTYQSDKVLEDNYETEWQDKVLYGPQYGPGNSQSQQKATGTILTGAIVVGSSILCPPLGATLAVSYTVGGTAAQVIGQVADLPALEQAGDAVSLGGSIGGGISKGLVGNMAKHTGLICKK